MSGVTRGFAELPTDEAMAIVSGPRMGFSRIIPCIVVMLLLTHATHVFAAAPTTAAQEVLLDKAVAAFDEALAARSNPPRAAELYRQSAGGFEALVQAGVRNAALEYNLGTAHYRAGELGRAVLHYRRAQRLNPGEARLSANLRYVREQVEPHLAPSGERSLRDRLLGWQGGIARVTRHRAALGAWLVGWAVLAVWLVRKQPTWRNAGLALVAIGALLGASVYAELQDEQQRPPAVVISGSHTLRKDRGDGADPALKQPLGPGVEVRIVQERGGWFEVELLNGINGWLPAHAVERV